MIYKKVNLKLLDVNTAKVLQFRYCSVNQMLKIHLCLFVYAVVACYCQMGPVKISIM